jgi:hypothetical protein
LVSQNALQIGFSSSAVSGCQHCSLTGKSEYFKLAFIGEINFLRIIFYIF